MKKITSAIVPISMVHDAKRLHLDRNGADTVPCLVVFLELHSFVLPTLGRLEADRQPTVSLFRRHKIEYTMNKI